MHKLTATFRIVTPMFIAGADQKKAELRVPSIKGALRFWWRALNWSRIRNDLNDDNSALAALKKQEADLFGDADVKGQSAVLIKLKDRLSNGVSGNVMLQHNARKYLGYGLFAMGDHGERVAVAEGKAFSISILIKNDFHERLREQLVESIQALGFLGGLGSRSRNGFGALSIQQLGDDKFRFDSPDKYKGKLTQLLNLQSRVEETAPYTAITHDSRIVFGSLGETSEIAHCYLDSIYRDFRMARQHEPRKKFFGLPLDGYDDNNRRASPLLFHVHPVGDRFLPVILYLPAKFHPNYPEYDYSLVEEFLNTIEEDV